jgi:hypothetical protein
LNPLVKALPTRDKMPAQLWIPNDDDYQIPDESQFKPVANDPHGAGVWKKPAKGTGLWTSTWDAERESCGWLDWMAAERWTPRSREPGEWVHQEFEAYIIWPDPRARVAVVDSYADLEALMRRFPHNDHLAERLEAISPGWNERHAALDFEGMARAGLAGMHLTDEGQWMTRLSNPHNLYGWDCESTVWFRWVFGTRWQRVTVTTEGKYGDDPQVSDPSG